MGADFFKAKAFEGWRICMRHHSKNAGMGKICPIPKPGLRKQHFLQPKTQIFVR